MNLEEFKKRVDTFLKCPDTGEGDMEYRAKKKALAPVLRKHKAESLRTLDPSGWPDVMKAIARYERGTK